MINRMTSTGLAACLLCCLLLAGCHLRKAATPADSVPAPVAPATSTPEWIPADVPTESPAPTETDATTVNINTATAEGFAALPGIGMVTAERIVAYRTEHGAFTSIEQLKQVKGIGPKTYEKIKDLVVATPPPAAQ